MKKIYIILIALLFSIFIFGQHPDLKYTVTNFGDTIIMDRSGNKATVNSMSVFGERTIENSRGEKITIKKDALGYVTIKSNKGPQVTLKETLMGERTTKDGYGGDAVVVIDQRGDIRITDSKGNEIVIKAGFYGNMQEIEKFAFFEEKRPHIRPDEDYDYDRDEREIYRAIRQNRAGELEYSERRQKAVLKKDSFERVIYEDSNGNELKFSKETWRKMTRRVRDEKRVFASLINMYL